jgi:hypothetical protein
MRDSGGRCRWSCDYADLYTDLENLDFSFPGEYRRQRSCNPSEFTAACRVLEFPDIQNGDCWWLDESRCSFSLNFLERFAAVVALLLSRL